MDENSHEQFTSFFPRDLNANFSPEAAKEMKNSDTFRQVNYLQESE